VIVVFYLRDRNLLRSDWKVLNSASSTGNLNVLRGYMHVFFLASSLAQSSFAVCATCSAVSSPLPPLFFPPPLLPLHSFLAISRDTRWRRAKVLMSSPSNRSNSSLRTRCISWKSAPSRIGRSSPWWPRRLESVSSSWDSSDSSLSWCTSPSIISSWGINKHD